MMIIYSNRMLRRPKLNEIYIDVYFWNDAISETSFPIFPKLKG